MDQQQQNYLSFTEYMIENYTLPLRESCTIYNASEQFIKLLNIIGCKYELGFHTVTLSQLQ